MKEIGLLGPVIEKKKGRSALAINNKGNKLKAKAKEKLYTEITKLKHGAKNIKQQIKTKNRFSVCTV